jgi:hypothetical protein
VHHNLRERCATTRDGTLCLSTRAEGGCVLSYGYLAENGWFPAAKVPARLRPKIAGEPHGRRQRQDGAARRRLEAARLEQERIPRAKDPNRLALEARFIELAGRLPGSDDAA